VRSRLAWLSLYVALAAAGIWAIAHGVGGWWAAPLWSLLIGNAFAGCAFVGHETMHGAVLRGKTVRQLIGWVCFLPFTLSPTLWNAWHNKVHHGNTGIDGVDPDSFPTRKTWERSRTTRIADYVAVGHNRPFGFLTLLFGFTGQSSQMLFVWSPSTDSLDGAERRRMWIEAMAGWAFWITVAWLIGPLAFLFAFVLPLLVANTIVISYILTNHSLSPMNDVNDPLLNSLTVEVPWIVNLVHLNFGLHVEHHLFPSMSSRYAPHVRDALIAQFPERYQSMPFLEAMRRLFSTPRVYETQTLLVDPLSGMTAPTLAPREAGTSEPVAAPTAPEVAPAPTPVPTAA
jgi:fatty acid desaturase